MHREHPVEGNHLAINLASRVSACRLLYRIEAAACVVARCDSLARRASTKRPCPAARHSPHVYEKSFSLPLRSRAGLSLLLMVGYRVRCHQRSQSEPCSGGNALQPDIAMRTMDIYHRSCEIKDQKGRPDQIDLGVISRIGLTGCPHTFVSTPSKSLESRLQRGRRISRPSIRCTGLQRRSCCSSCEPLGKPDV